MHTDASPALQWFAITTKPNLEKSVTASLAGRGLSSFLPTYGARRIWSDRIKDIEQPLFPGYTFCQFMAERRAAILSVSGVTSIVGFGRGPVPVEEDEMAALRAIVASGAAALAWPFVRVGDRVRVSRGALAGLEGILVSDKSRWRVVVSITLLQRSVAVEIDRDWLRPVRGFDPRRAGSRDPIPRELSP
ncbi:MAG: NusG-like protein [Acidobacteria bacterium]|nr:NusG-like protein [Acidobacteriota bacterium]